MPDFNEPLDLDAELGSDPAPEAEETETGIEPPEQEETEVEPPERKDKDELRAELAAMRAKLSAIEADRLQQAASQQKAAQAVRVTQLQAQHQQTLAAFEKALEDGEPKEAAKLADALTDIKVELRAAEAAAKEPPAAQPTGAIHPFEREFMKQNAGWLEQPGFEEETAVAGSLYRAMVAKGNTPDTPKFWADYEKRLRAAVGDSLADNLKGLNQKGRAATPIHGNGRDRAPGASTGSLSKFELREMQKRGLDPHNPKDRQKWLRAG